MANYFFLISAFPPLKFGVRPLLSFKEVREMLPLNLTDKDMLAVRRLLRPLDLYNLRALWLEAPLNEEGNFNAKDLEDSLLQKGIIPTFLSDFLDRYDSTAERLHNFPSLYASLYREMSDLKGFLAKYYQFEREVRLILTALRCKTVGRDPIVELQFEDPTEFFIADILAQKESPDYVPPKEYEDLKTFFLDNTYDPRKLQQAILQYRFNKIEEMEDSQDFSIDRVLAYLARLLIVEESTELDDYKSQGMVVVGNLSQYG